VRGGKERKGKGYVIHEYNCDNMCLTTCVMSTYNMRDEYIQHAC